MSRGAASAPIHAVILAGGAGERFWPASRRHLPKPFLEVIGGKSLLEATLERARRVAGEDRVWIVCGDAHAAAVRKESGLPARRVLVEPRRRNTAMAAAWVAQRVAAEDPEAVLCVLPADHHIPDVRAFTAAIRKAARAASRANVLVTLGVEPTRPDVGYGYIQVGAGAGRDFPGLQRVRRFVEKPDLPRARRYLAQGSYLWNAGIFVWRAQTFLAEVESCAPDLHRALAPLRRAPRDRRRSVVEAAYRRAPSLPVDVAILEVSESVWTLPVGFRWSDVGTWGSLAEELGVGGQEGPRRCDKILGRGVGNRVIDGDVVVEDSSSNLVWGGDQLIALVGVEGLAVVDTGDVILVTKLDRSSDVRRVVATLKSSGRDSLL